MHFSTIASVALTLFAAAVVGMVLVVPLRVPLLSLGTLVGDFVDSARRGRQTTSAEAGASGGSPAVEAFAALARSRSDLVKWLRHDGVVVAISSYLCLR